MPKRFINPMLTLIILVSARSFRNRKGASGVPRMLKPLLTGGTSWISRLNVPSCRLKVMSFDKCRVPREGHSKHRQMVGIVKQSAHGHRPSQAATSYHYLTYAFGAYSKGAVYHVAEPSRKLHKLEGGHVHTKPIEHSGKQEGKRSANM